MNLPFYIIVYLQYFLISPALNLGIIKKTGDEITSESKIITSTDGGKTWEDLSGNLPKENFDINCLFIDENEILLGTESGLYRTEASKIAWTKDHLFEENLRKFILLKSGLFARNHPKGPYKKIDGSGAWIPAFRSLNPDFFIFTVNETSNGDFYASTNKGLWKSLNPKAEQEALIYYNEPKTTWKSVISEKPIFKCIQHDEQLFALSHSGLLRSSDQGNTWNNVFNSEGETLELKFIDHRLVAWTTGLPYDLIGPVNVKKNQMHYSDDNGITWKSFDEGLKKENIYDFDFDGENIYVSHEKGVSKTNDWGKTWFLILPNSDKKLIYHIVIFKEKLVCTKAMAGC